MSSRETIASSTGKRPRKARRGTDTRRRIEETAARLFTSDGYTATTMQAIASQADVHVQTIYLAYGTKPALLAACAARLVAGDEDPETPPAERRWAREIAAEPDPHAKLIRYVKHIGDVSPRITPLIDVLRATAPAEPEVAWRSKYFHLVLRRGRKIAKVAMARRLAVQLFWMMRKEWDYEQLKKFGSHAGQPGHRDGVQSNTE